MAQFVLLSLSDSFLTTPRPFTTRTTWSRTHQQRLIRTLLLLLLLVIFTRQHSTTGVLAADTNGGSSTATTANEKHPHPSHKNNAILLGVTYVPQPNPIFTPISIKYPYIHWTCLQITSTKNGQLACCQNIYQLMKNSAPEDTLCYQKDQCRSSQSQSEFLQEYCLPNLQKLPESSTTTITDSSIANDTASSYTLVLSPTSRSIPSKLPWRQLVSTTNSNYHWMYEFHSPYHVPFGTSSSTEPSFEAHIHTSLSFTFGEDTPGRLLHTLTVPPLVSNEQDLQLQFIVLLISVQGVRLETVEHVAKGDEVTSTCRNRQVQRISTKNDNMDDVTLHIVKVSADLDNQNASNGPCRIEFQSSWELDDFDEHVLIPPASIWNGTAASTSLNGMDSNLFHWHPNTKTSDKTGPSTNYRPIFTGQQKIDISTDTDSMQTDEF